MATVQPIRPAATVPPQDPTRAALAVAIEAYETAHSAAEEARGAVLRAKDNLNAAHRRAIDAEQAIEKARQMQATSLVEAARNGGAAPGKNPLRAARQAETEALDEVEAARSALAVVEEELGGIEYTERRTYKQLQKAAHEVLAAVAPELMQRMHNKWNAFLREFYAVKFIAGYLEPGEERKAVMDSALYHHHLRDQPVLDETAGKQPWSDALVALMSDANAPLPESA